MERKSGIGYFHPMKLFQPSIAYLFFSFGLSAAFAQAVQTPQIPDFTFIKMDSTQFSCHDLKPGKYTCFIHFSPDCDHCQNEITNLMMNYYKFKDTQFILTSSQDYVDVKSFYEAFYVAEYPNITAVWDPDRKFSSVFHSQYVPYVALFDKHQRLLKTIEGESKITDWLNWIH